MLIIAGSVHAEPTEINARKSLLTWELAWLQFESDFLTTQTIFSSTKQDVDLVIKYQDELIAVRALFHCNKQGNSIKDVIEYLQKISTAKEKPLMPCVQDFYKIPNRYWNSKDNPVGNKFTIAYYGIPLFGVFSKFHQEDILKYAKTNPTISNILTGINGNYERFYVQSALENEGNTQEAIDLYNRVINRILKGKNGKSFRTTVAFYWINANKNERDAIKTVYECSKTINDKNPFSYIYKKTINLDSKKLIYDKTIPCIYKKDNLHDMIAVFKRLQYGIRSDTFSEILRESNRDIKYSGTSGFLVMLKT